MEISMKKKYIIGFIILLFCSILSLLVLKLSRFTEDTSLKNNIIETIQTADEIDFNKITDFDWDKLYIFTPYSIPEDVLKQDGIHSRKSNFRIELLDTFYMVGFVKSNKLISYIELPRDYIGSNLSHTIHFNPEEATFRITNKQLYFIEN